MCVDEAEDSAALSGLVAFFVAVEKGVLALFLE